MQILVTRGLVVEAETIEEALEKTKPVEGITVSVSANPRPALPQSSPQAIAALQRATGTQTSAKP